MAKNGQKIVLKWENLGKNGEKLGKNGVKLGKNRGKIGNKKIVTNWGKIKVPKKA